MTCKFSNVLYVCCIYLNHYLLLWLWQQKVFVCLVCAHYSFDMAEGQSVYLCVCACYSLICLWQVYLRVFCCGCMISSDLSEKQMAVIVLAHNFKKLRTTKLSHLHTAGITDCKMMYTYTCIHNLLRWKLEGIQQPLSEVKVKVVNTLNGHAHTHTLTLRQQAGSQTVLWDLWNLLHIRKNLQGNGKYRYAYITYF